MSSQVYCNCNRPNTRQTAFARANGFDCPDCNKRLNPDPNAETYQDDNNDQETPSSPTPNFLPPSPLSQHGSFPIPPENYPGTLSELLDNLVEKTNLLEKTKNQLNTAGDKDNTHHQYQSDPPRIPLQPDKTINKTLTLKKTKTTYQLFHQYGIRLHHHT